MDYPIRVSTKEYSALSNALFTFVGKTACSDKEGTLDLLFRIMDNPGERWILLSEGECKLALDSTLSKIEEYNDTIDEYLDGTSLSYSNLESMDPEVAFDIVSAALDEDSFQCYMVDIDFRHTLMDITAKLQNALA